VPRPRKDTPPELYHLPEIGGGKLDTMKIQITQLGNKNKYYSVDLAYCEKFESTNVAVIAEKVKDFIIKALDKIN
jgi:hypothetical protein